MALAKNVVVPQEVTQADELEEDGDDFEVFDIPAYEEVHRASEVSFHPGCLDRHLFQI